MINNFLGHKFLYKQVQSNCSSFEGIGSEVTGICFDIGGPILSSILTTSRTKLDLEHSSSCHPLQSPLSLRASLGLNSSILCCKGHQFLWEEIGGICFMACFSTLGKISEPQLWSCGWKQCQVSLLLTIRTWGGHLWIYLVWRWLNSCKHMP
jgi:hypothetical protein